MATSRINIRSLIVLKPKMLEETMQNAKNVQTLLGSIQQASQSAFTISN